MKGRTCASLRIFVALLNFSLGSDDFFGGWEPSSDAWTTKLARPRPRACRRDTENTDARRSVPAHWTTLTRLRTP